MNKLATICFLASLLLAARIANAQYQISWTTSFDGGLGYSDFVADSAVDTGGNIYVAGTVNNPNNGSTADIAIYKYSPQGALLWSRTWDGPGADQDVAFGMALTPDGSLVVVGRTNTPTTSSDFVTLKIRREDGALLWARTFDGPAHSIDEALAVAVDSAGGIIVTGEAWNDAEWYSNGDYCTVKYDANGNLLWSRLYDAPGNGINISDQARRIVVDATGDVIVSGDSPDVSMVAWTATVKYRGSDGAELWALRSDSIGVSGYQAALEIASNGDPVLGMNSQDFGLQVVLIRIDGATGQATWVKRDEFPHGGRLRHTRALTLDGSGNPVIAVTYDPDVDNSNLNYNLQTTKYSFLSGDRLWSTSVGTDVKYDSQGAGVVTTDAQGNVLVAGQNLVVPHTRLALWKFASADGQLSWSTDIAFPLNSDVPERVVFDGVGNIIVAGQTVNTNNGYADIFVAKYATNAPEAALSALSLNPASVPGGKGSTGTVTLTAPAPTGGKVVTLASSAVTASVPATVTVAAGALSATFGVDTFAVAATSTVTISATDGAITKTAPLTVQRAAVSSVAFTPASLVGGGATGTVTLTGPAPSGGLTVTLLSNRLEAKVPASVFVEQGLSSATFPVTTSVVTVNTTATISGSVNGSTRSGKLLILPLLKSIAAAPPGALVGGKSSLGTVTLNAPAPAGGITANLSSSSAAAGVPATVTVTSGATSATFPISTVPVAAATAVTLTAEYAGVKKTATLTVKPPALASLKLTPSTVKGGNSVVGTVTLSGAAAVATTVALTNANPSAALPAAYVTIPAGGTSATFTMTTSPVGVTVSGAVQATLGTVTKSVTLTVTP